MEPPRQTTRAVNYARVSRLHNTHYYTGDANFNVTATIDATTGDIVERYVCTAYGKATVYSPTWTTPTAPATDGPLYCGYFFDAETALYQVRHRYYDSSLSTFTSRDPIGYEGDINFYRYVGDSPLNAVDPEGLAGDSVTAAIERCLRLPFPANIKCLNDLLGSGYKDKEIRIIQCELAHAAYKAAGAACRKCTSTMTKTELLANAACFTAEVTIRARYLSMKCDCILPGSIARGTKIAYDGHVKELAAKSAAAAACYALAAKAK